MNLQPPTAWPSWCPAAGSFSQLRSTLTCGIEPISSCVYGCCGAFTTSSTSPASATDGAIQHDDVVGHLIGGGQIVRDVDDRDAELLVQLAQRAQDGRAQRRIDHRDRLVGDDQLRAQQQRARHHDALALAAAELMRIAAEDLLGPQADRAQRVLDQAAAFGLRPGQTELRDRRRQHMIHPVERIVDLVRVLEDRLHVAPEVRAVRCPTGRADRCPGTAPGPPSARPGPAAGAPASSCRCRFRRRRR